MTVTDSGPTTRPRIGFAALWDAERETTWSYMPHRLLEAMVPIADVVELGVDLDPGARVAVRALAARLAGGRPVTLWRSNRWTDGLVDHSLRRAVDRHRPDVVVEITDLWPATVPYVPYRDVYWGQIEQFADQGVDMATLGHPGMSARRLRDRRRREDDLLRGAAAVATLSRWSAAYLVDDLGLDPARVHVVPPAANALALPDRGPADASRRSRPRRLLFVGRDFGRKGGRLLLDAFAVVRARRPDVTLTVIGPDRWPVDGTPPPGVEFLGRQPASLTAVAFATHDLFVMPSLFEPYGIVYVEAIAAGMPCVAPAAWAIEEIVDDQRTGRLVAGRDAEHWAREIAAALDDEDLFASTAAEAPHLRAHFRWDRVAHQMVEICTRATGGAPSPTRPADPGHHTPGANHV